MKTYFDEKQDINLADIIEKIRKLSKSSKVYFSQVITLLKILLVLPAQMLLMKDLYQLYVELKTGFERY